MEGDCQKITPFPMNFMEKMELSSGTALATRHPTYNVTGPSPGHEDPDVEED